MVSYSRRPEDDSSVEIGETTNNVAELEAIHDALRWISVTVLSSGMLVRVYTDSKYSRDVLIAASTPRYHAYLLESIKALTAKLRYDHASPVTVHWIPSHIENTSWGRLPIHGNCRADKLAESARKRSHSSST